MRRFSPRVELRFRLRQVAFGFIIGARTSYVMAWPFLLTVEV